MTIGGWRTLGRLMLVLGLLAGCATPSPEVSTAGARAARTPLRHEGAHHEARHTRCRGAHYRLPVVSQVTVPTTIVGGVLIPQHRTYVVLQPGAWRVVETEARRQPARPSIAPDCRLRSAGDR